MKLDYRAIFISDLHLGSSGCRADEVADFLKLVECDTLYLVGDILDMWRLKQRWHWPESHNRVVKRLLKMAKRGTRVVYIPGNHDDKAREYTGVNFGGVEIAMDAVHETADGKRLLVTHGDQFDLVVKHAKLLSALGSWAYDHLLRINWRYNRLRRRFGLKYWSLSQFLKLKVKSACSYISKFEDALTKEATAKGFDGVVCGHIHKAEIRLAGGQATAGAKAIAYYNCGDWVESCTALVEHEDGTIQLLGGSGFVEGIRELIEKAPQAAPEPVVDAAEVEMIQAIARAQAGIKGI